jgi:hypothetical protein
MSKLKALAPMLGTMGFFILGQVLAPLILGFNPGQAFFMGVFAAIHSLFFYKSHVFLRKFWPKSDRYKLSEAYEAFTPRNKTIQISESGVMRPGQEEQIVDFTPSSVENEIIIRAALAVDKPFVERKGLTGCVTLKINGVPIITETTTQPIGDCQSPTLFSYDRYKPRNCEQLKIEIQLTNPLGKPMKLGKGSFLSVMERMK